MSARAGRSATGTGFALGGHPDEIKESVEFLLGTPLPKAGGDHVDGIRFLMVAEGPESEPLASLVVILGIAKETGGEVYLVAVVDAVTTCGKQAFEVSIFLHVVSLLRSPGSSRQLGEQLNFIHKTNTGQLFCV